MRKHRGFFIYYAVRLRTRKSDRGAIRPNPVMPAQAGIHDFFIPSAALSISKKAFIRRLRRFTQMTRQNASA
jgi:hypothetical protein